MPDIKTALTTALNEWEQQAEDANKLGAARASGAVNPSTLGGTVIKAAAPTPPKPTPRPNMTRDTFAMVRDNPGISRADAIERLQAMGHKPVSTGSILYQLVRAKMIDEGPFGTLSTKRKNYTSLTHALEKAPKGRRKTRMQKPKAVELKDVRSPAGFVGTPEEQAAPQPQATPEPQTTPFVNWQQRLADKQRVSDEIDEWLNSVTLRYASLVYERLHYIFGAKK
jgi:hypothetical protein